MNPIFDNQNFKTTGIDDFVPILDTMEQALKAF
jgi:hypothetical protein